MFFGLEALTLANLLERRERYERAGDDDSKEPATSSLFEPTKEWVSLPAFKPSYQNPPITVSLH